jgi:hypothetical protein
MHGMELGRERSRMAYMVDILDSFSSGMRSRDLGFFVHEAVLWLVDGCVSTQCSIRHQKLSAI